MYQKQNQMKPSHSDMEELKKNWKDRVEKLAKDKTLWLNDFKETYKKNREPIQEIETVESYMKQFKIERNGKKNKG